MKLVITIPAYNEEETIGSVISNVKSVLEKSNHDFLIQVVDDGSTDRTATIARESGAVVYSHHCNYGLAATFKNEITRALENDADTIVHIDADGQYRAEEIIPLIKPIENGEADLVLGSRFMGEIEEMPTIKQWGNRAFSKVVSQITKTEITDAQTGYRAFTREVATNVNVFSSFTYTQEQIIKSVENRFRVQEIPIYFAKREAGSSRLMTHPLDYAIKAGINLTRIYRDFAPLRFFGLIGFSLFLLAVLVSLYSFFAFNRVMDVTILILFISSIQIVTFGFLAEMVRNKY
ncbi:MAG: family 2 glycosyl transferase [Methanolobus sp. T82-4]|nr:MAG: family 2 glycosyl transferase [Methanolobus sp. T82-4]